MMRAVLVSSLGLVFFWGSFFNSFLLLSVSMFDEEPSNKGAQMTHIKQKMPTCIEE